jgi:hypothetical protein
MEHIAHGLAASCIASAACRLIQSRRVFYLRTRDENKARRQAYSKAGRAVVCTLHALHFKASAIALWSWVCL